MILMQELCKVDLGWDQSLDGELLAELEAIIDALMKGPLIVLPRCYLSYTGDGTLYRLYGFCDASTAAYAAVVYQE